MDTPFPTIAPWIGRRVFRSWGFSKAAAQQQAVMELIAVGIEQNLPLALLLAHWAQDERGLQHERLVRLVALLNEGQSLPDAIEAIPGLVRDEDLLALRFDAQSGARTHAVRSLLATSQEAPISRGRRSLAYLFTVIPLMALAISFLQNVVTPKLIKTFDDFGANAPTALRWAEGLHGWTRFLGWVAPMTILLALLILFATRAGHRIRRSIFGRFFGPVRQALAADVLQKIGVAIAAGRPIPGAVSTLARYHYDPATRRQLLFVRNEIEQGAETWRSLAAVGMLAPAEADLLRAYESSPDRVWLLNQLVEAKQRKSSRRRQRLGEFIMPAVVLLLACVVLLQALAVMQPLTQIIQGMS